MTTTTVEWGGGVVGICCSARGVVEVSLSGEIADCGDDSLEAARYATLAATQFSEYFRGERRTFDLPLDCEWMGAAERGAFREDVLRTLAHDVPYGSVVTYGALAAMAGRPRAARAAGTACSTNPFAIIVPCHRVVPAGGGAGKFGGGEHMKKWLLELEESVTEPEPSQP